MSEKTPEKTPLTILLDTMEQELGRRPKLSHPRDAGKVLQKDGEEAARDFILKDQEKTTRPPAKCDIVAMSRPLSEWPLVQVGENIQRYIYNLPHDKFLKLKEKGVSGKDAHDAFFRESGVQGIQGCVQGLNLIFRHAMNRYTGTIKRLETKNEKLREKADRINGKLVAKGQKPEPFEPIPIFDEQGYLSEKPGINPNLYCFQQIAPTLLNANDGVELPPEYADYNLDPEATISGMGDRLSIPKGMPGYVPEWQRAAHPEKDEPLSTNKHRRMRPWYSAQNLKEKEGRRPTSPERLALAAKEKARDAILCIIRLGNDWVVFNLRGAIRNGHWRRLIPKKATPSQALGLFTGDPVINTRSGVVTLLYKDGITNVVPVQKLRVKAGREKLLELTKSVDGRQQQVAVVTVDLGETNPIAAGIFRVSQTENSQLTHTRMGGDTYWWRLTDDLTQAILSYRRRYNEMEARFQEVAINSLSTEDQVAFRQYRGNLSEKTKQIVCDYLGLDAANLPWDQMRSSTNFITNAYLAQGGDKSRVEFTHPPKSRNCKDKMCKHVLSVHTENGCTCCGCKHVPSKDQLKKYATRITEVRDDGDWAHQFRPQLDKNIRAAHSKAAWDLKRGSTEFEQLSKSKKELCRRAINVLIAETRRLTQCQAVVFVIEDLNATFFHGKGKRAMGWEALFKLKAESRWFIQAMHKTLDELPMNKGIWIIEASPWGTSRMCPYPTCRHYDAESRNGENFRCTKCGRSFHADGEVATYNLLDMALTGAHLPKSSEQQSAEQKTETARDVENSGIQIPYEIPQAEGRSEVAAE
jgi:hypothetical protein